PGDFLQFPGEVGDAGLDPSPIRLEFRLTRPAAGTDATGLLAHLRATTSQPRQVVAVEGQFDLEGALAGGGVLGEDVEDDRLPVDDVAVEHFLEAPLLSRCGGAAAHHHVDGEGGGDGGRVGRVAGVGVGGG